MIHAAGRTTAVAHKSLELEAEDVAGITSPARRPRSNSSVAQTNVPIVNRSAGRIRIRRLQRDDFLDLSRRRVSRSRRDPILPDHLRATL